MNITAEAKDLSEQQPLYEKCVNPQIDLMHASTGFWTEALGMARRAINVI